MATRVWRRGFAGMGLTLTVLVGCSDDRGSSGVPRSAPGGAAGSASSAGTSSAGAGASSGGANAGVSGHGDAGAGGVTSGAGGVTSGVAGTGGSGCATFSSALLPWPGKNEITTLDAEPQFRSDLSGLTYEPGAAGAAGVLWAVNNLSSTLFRLVQSTDGFAPDTMNDWAAGKSLRFPNGSGAPDSESVTFGASVADGVYICSEHDNDDASVSRLSVLRYDVSQAGAVLTATHEWDVTALLPQVGANTGLEAITWVPDSYLTARGFLDEARAHAYAPGDYANHGSGLFLVGVEETGKIYALALNHGDGSAGVVASITTPNSGVMGLELDREASNLWFNCDETCGNRSGILDIDTRPGSATLGKLVVRRQFLRPSSLPDSNNEGIAIAPESECVDGYKRFFWTDDADQSGFSLRSDSIACGSCL
jgi:hypothetical protein